MTRSPDLAQDELLFRPNALTVLRERYLLRDDEGRVTETPGEAIDRCARHVAAAEDAFVPGSSERWSEEFSQAMRSLLFLPNSPTLMNAGTRLGLLSGCFVLPVEDSLDSIFSTLKDMALIQQAGGGTGFSFSAVRPKGDLVASTHNVATGPVSFLRLFDMTADVVKQGGRRRGANMGVLAVTHPDIEEFATAKAQDGALENFNLSVAATDAFMQAVEADGVHRLVNPRTGEVTRELRARELFELLATQAQRTGDPGLVFVDRINQDNAVPSLGRIEATNPCGEVPLLPNESCNLGSVNLARMAGEGEVDWELLRRTVRLLTRFLDDVIEVNRYPTPAVEQATRATRKIGVGVMGLAELLAELEIPYDSEEGVGLAGEIARAVRDEATATSAELAAERGPFPLFAESRLGRNGSAPRRNAQLLALAPTGTISVIAGTTSGIEPMFALAYTRNVLGRRLVEVNPIFERVAQERGFYSEELVREVEESGGVRANEGVPADVRRVFATALEVAPQWHLRMQAAFQRFTDAAVSKTINLPASATPEEVMAIYLDAWRADLKGITVYRYGSKESQVLTVAGDGDGTGKLLEVGPAYAGGCADFACEV
jgi:ribonucleoside-diphosphate reductase alpha chain